MQQAVNEFNNTNACGTCMYVPLLKHGAMPHHQPYMRATDIQAWCAVPLKIIIRSETLGANHGLITRNPSILEASFRKLISL